MRALTKIFAAFDLISIILLFQPVLDLMKHFDEVPDSLLSQARVWLTFPLFLSLFASAIGLALFKKFGWIAYYIQFPFRLVLWVFSIGFITLLPEWLNLSDGWFNALFRICIIAEFFRLYFTVKIHRKYF
ncbi:hypothetical protein ABIB40_001171 [Pedobacter sp. UYP30]|uniref:hypothetical protein n=1 Tax=Pedobacter sp. UYP30 TaxID=1756400 RepID=UPI00339A541D